MKTIKIYGASDDLIEVEGDLPGCDEYNPYSHGVLTGTFRLDAGERHIRVHCLYDGSWAFAVCPQDGDCDRMEWPVSYAFGKDTPYSWTVTIQVPDDCKISWGK